MNFKEFEEYLVNSTESDTEFFLSQAEEISQDFIGQYKPTEALVFISFLASVIQQSHIAGIKTAFAAIEEGAI